MQVDERQLFEVSRDVWSSLLGLQVRSVAGSGKKATERIWSSRINVSGDWQGAIVVECPESIGRHAAAMLYEADGEQTPEDEIRDAISEVASRVGDRVRSLLPEDARLSRPATTPDGIDRTAGESFRELRLDCEGRIVRIALLTSAPATVAD
jgi:hypothetical protein